MHESLLRRWREWSNEYAGPNVSWVRRFLAREIAKCTRRARRGSSKALGLGLVAARKLARPECLYPDCTNDVANWVIDGYIPVDTWLCQEHMVVCEQTHQAFLDELKRDRGMLLHYRFPYARFSQDDHQDYQARMWAIWHQTGELPVIRYDDHRKWLDGVVR